MMVFVTFFMTVTLFYIKKIGPRIFFFDIREMTILAFKMSSSQVYKPIYIHEYTTATIFKSRREIEMTVSYRYLLFFFWYLRRRTVFPDKSRGLNERDILSD